MCEHQMGTALYCALGTGCRSGAELRRCLRVATIPSSHEDHPRPPIHSGGSWPSGQRVTGRGATPTIARR